MTSLSDLVDVVIGIDSHRDTHTAAVVDAGTGAVLAEWCVATTAAGYSELISKTENFGGARVWAIESAGHYAAGLVRCLVERDEWVIEIDRPARPARRGGAKSDPIDAVRAARDALARPSLGEPRAAGQRRALAMLISARRLIVDSAADAMRQLHALVVAAPDPIRTRLRDHNNRALLAAAAKLRHHPSHDLETTTTIDVIRDLARRISSLREQAANYQNQIKAIVTDWRPDLLAQPGVGPITAAVLLCVWSHPGRFRNEAAFAKLCGVAPIPASSGQTHRHRLNPGGDRQANRAIHTITITRLAHDPTTRAYRDRRRAEGKTDREIRRCLKRFIARQLFRLLETTP